MVLRLLLRIAGLLLAGGLAPFAGFEAFHQAAPPAQPVPVVAPAATPLPYGSFGGPGSPYGPASRAVAAPGGAFSDQQPAASSNLPGYNPGDLNGGERGFVPAHLTVNTTLPGH